MVEIRHGLIIRRQSLRKRMDYNREMIIERAQAEIKALEYQINPHFLYNTLDAINWMAVKKEEYEIRGMADRR